MQVSHGPGLPVAGQQLRLGADHLAVSRDALAKECRLRQPSLPHMQRLLRRQETVPQHLAPSLHH